MQRVLTCISFPGQSLAEVCAMVCALWAAQNNWIKFRKARKANFPRKEDLEYVSKQSLLSGNCTNAACLGIL